MTPMSPASLALVLMLLVAVARGQVESLPVLGDWTLADGDRTTSDGELYCAAKVFFGGVEPASIELVIYDSVRCPVSPTIQPSLNMSARSKTSNFVADQLLARDVGFLTIQSLDNPENLTHELCAAQQDYFTVTSSAIIFEVETSVSLADFGITEFFERENITDSEDYSHNFTFVPGKTYLFVRDDCIYSHDGPESSPQLWLIILGSVLVGISIVILIALMSWFFIFGKRKGRQSTTQTTTANVPATSTSFLDSYTTDPGPGPHEFNQPETHGGVPYPGEDRETAQVPI